VSDEESEEPPRLEWLEVTPAEAALLEADLAAYLKLTVSEPGRMIETLVEHPPYTAGSRGRRRVCPVCGLSQVVLNGMRFGLNIHFCLRGGTTYQVTWPGEGPTGWYTAPDPPRRRLNLPDDGTEDTMAWDATAYEDEENET
jgi:hypothetical protein